MKKILICLFFLLMSSASVFAIESSSVTPADKLLQDSENLQSDSNKEKETNFDEVNFDLYMDTLQKKIKKNWKPFHINKSATAVISFRIAKDGSMSYCNVFKSSGIDSFDDIALRAVHFSAPFNPLPEKYNGDFVNIEFKFEYNVYGSKAKINRYSISEHKHNFVNYSIAESSPSKLIERNLQSRECKRVFKNYMKDVSTIISSMTFSLYKPSIVRIKFFIQKDGTVTGPKISASNGNKLFNNEVLGQIKNLQFNPIPSELNLESIPVEYQFNNYIIPKPKTMADYILPIL